MWLVATIALVYKGMCEYSIFTPFEFKLLLSKFAYQVLVNVKAHCFLKRVFLISFISLSDYLNSL